MIEQAAVSTRWTSIAIWVLRVPVALLFLFAAFMKFSGQPMMVAEFREIGLGQGFRYLTAAIESVGAVALLIPRSSRWGGLILLMVDIGAFVAQVAVLHKGWVHTVVIAVILGASLYLQRRTIR